MKREQFFKICIVCLISIILLIGIYKIITTSLKVNQGKYRVADVVVTSTADIVSRTEENAYLSFDASQKNTISLLIVPSDAKTESISLENVTITGKNNSIYISQKDREEVLVSDIQVLPIDVQYREDGNILLELEITNQNILTNKKLEDNVEELRYDGRVFKDAGLTLQDLALDIDFDVKIVEENGTENILNVEMNTPNEKFLTEGYHVERMDLGSFVFKTK